MLPQQPWVVENFTREGGEWVRHRVKGITAPTIREDLTLTWDTNNNTSNSEIRSEILLRPALLCHKDERQ